MYDNKSISQKIVRAMYSFQFAHRILKKKRYATNNYVSQYLTNFDNTQIQISKANKQNKQTNKAKNKNKTNKQTEIQTK